MVEERGDEGPEEVVRQRLREAAAAVSTRKRAATGSVLTRPLCQFLFYSEYIFYFILIFEIYSEYIEYCEIVIVIKFKKKLKRFKIYLL